MQKRMMINIDQQVYEGIVRIVGREGISRFIEDLARSHVNLEAMDSDYADMAADEERERQAAEWSDSLISDTMNATR